MNKKTLITVLSALVVILFGIGITVSFLLASSQPVINTFTVGSVEIELRETTGSKYKLIPGADIKKDPVVTVLAGSEESWLFVKIEKQNNFDAFCEFNVDSSWSALPSHNGVYYQKVPSALNNTRYQVLENDSVHVKETVTENQLSEINANPKLNVTAYAIQSDGLESAHDAWREIEG